MTTKLKDQPKTKADLRSEVQSKILQTISDNFKNNLVLAEGTQHVKSDGGNYSMHTKSDAQ